MAFCQLATGRGTGEQKGGKSATRQAAAIIKIIIIMIMIIIIIAMAIAIGIMISMIILIMCIMINNDNYQNRRGAGDQASATEDRQTRTWEDPDN